MKKIDAKTRRKKATCRKQKLPKVKKMLKANK